MISKSRPFGEMQSNELKHELLVCLVLEYLVPSTGKLYHHKMKMRSLGGDSDVEETLNYLEKRHPLYFCTGKLRKEQVRDLVKKLIFKLKQKGVKASGSLATGAASATKTGSTSAVKEKDSLDPMSLAKAPAMKSKK